MAEELDGDGEEGLVTFVEQDNFPGLSFEPRVDYLMHVTPESEDFLDKCRVQAALT